MLYFPLDTCGADLTVWVEGGDEVPGDEIIDLSFLCRETRGTLSCGDDGMVIGDLSVVEDLLALAYGGSTQ